jgi:hypothetical protein
MKKQNLRIPCKLKNKCVLNIVVAMIMDRIKEREDTI